MHKKSILGLTILIVGMCGLTGCPWDNQKLYDEYVVDGNRVVFCPPELKDFNYKDGKVGSIILNSIKCEQGGMTANPAFAAKHKTRFSLEQDADKCIQSNYCLPIDECKGCDDYLLDYLSCKYFQTSGFFDFSYDRIKSEVETGIRFVGDGDNFLDKYNESKKYNICPKEFPICSFRSNEQEIGFECVQNNLIECAENQILCNKECISPMTSNVYCGSDKNCIKSKCPEHGYCANGKCHCPDGEVECDGKCINPKFDDSFCGAKEGCLDAQKCISNNDHEEQCINGVCTIKRCLNEKYPIKCSTLDQQKAPYECVDTSNNNEHCGACNLRCGSSESAKNGKYECLNGHCSLIECNDNLKKCPLKTEDGNYTEDFGCVNNQDNSMYCGDCISCKEQEFCSQGVCTENNCQESDVCPSICKNTDIKCGRKCIDCTSLPNVLTGICDINNGKCKVVCKNGYSPNKDNSSCGCDSVESCKSEPGWADGICSNGKCFVKSCKNDYTLVSQNGEQFCIKKEEACGENPDCKSFLGDVNIIDTKCVDSNCYVSRCAVNFHISHDGKSCIANSVNDCAPGDSSSTINCENIDRWNRVDCKEGGCIPLECSDGGYVNQFGQCVRDYKNGYYCEGNAVDIDKNASTIYCKKNSKYRGWDVLACKLGYKLDRKYTTYQFCKNSKEICYWDSYKQSLYYNYCVADSSD